MSLLTNMHLYSWKMGEKTSSYYIRVKQQTTGAKLLDASEDECLSCSA
jgi:ribonucleotide reductase alpha subunit